MVTTYCGRYTSIVELQGSDSMVGVYLGDDCQNGIYLEPVGHILPTPGVFGVY